MFVCSFVCPEFFSNTGHRIFLKLGMKLKDNSFLDNKYFIRRRKSFPIPRISGNGFFPPLNRPPALEKTWFPPILAQKPKVIPPHHWGGHYNLTVTRIGWIGPDGSVDVGLVFGKNPFKTFQ